MSGRNEAALGRASVLLGLLSVAAFVVAGFLWFGARTSSNPSVLAVPAAAGAPGTTASELGAASAAPPPATSSARAVADPDAGPPTRVVVESLGIDAPVLPVATQGTSLTPPDDPQVLGWWSGGAPVGAAQGTALVTGHTVNAGGGALDDLERVRPGAEIEVTTASGSLTYVAVSVQVLDKATLADRAAQLFDQRVPGRLALVTCEGWDGTGYRSNVVVTARLSS